MPGEAATVIDTGLVQCATCGTESDRSAAGEPCPICLDERQYLPFDGVQRWTTVGEQRSLGARLELREREPGLWGLEPHGGIGIGQQAKLAVTAAGNLLFDVPGSIDDAAVEAVRALGGIAAIIPSHPHMFGVMSAWSAAFDDAPVWVSELDAGWVQRPFEGLRTWSDAIDPIPGVRASQPGGHFPGSAVAHVAGHDGRGVLLSGDTIFVSAARGWVTFMRSYPNRIPLSGAVARRIAAHVTSRYAFDRLYNNFEGVVPEDASAAVLRSADRYARWTAGEFDHLTGPG